MASERLIGGQRIAPTAPQLPGSSSARRKGNCLKELPTEILFDIVDKLSKRNALHLRSTCKIFRYIVSPGLLRSIRLVFAAPSRGVIREDVSPPHYTYCNIHGWYDGSIPACNATTRVWRLARSINPLMAKCGFYSSDVSLGAVREVAGLQHEYTLDPVTAPLLRYLTTVPQNYIAQYTTEFVFRFDRNWFNELGCAGAGSFAYSFGWFCDYGLRRVLTSMNALKVVRVLSQPELEGGPRSGMMERFNRTLSMYCAEIGKVIDLHVAAVIQEGKLSHWAVANSFVASFYSVTSLAIAFPPGPEHDLSGRTREAFEKEITALIYRSPKLEGPESVAASTITYNKGRTKCHVGPLPNEWVKQHKGGHHVWAYALVYGEDL